MIKRPDTGARKKLRITMCVLFLFQIIICTFPFIHFMPKDGDVTTASPFYMVTMLFGSAGALTEDILRYCAISIAVIIIPVVGFFFCALDKEYNLKNIASALCCLAGVYITLVISRRAVSYGAVMELLLYVLIMLLTSFAMVMRLSKDEEKRDEEKRSLK